MSSGIFIRSEATRKPDKFASVKICKNEAGYIRVEKTLNQLWLQTLGQKGGKMHTLEDQAFFFLRKNEFQKGRDSTSLKRCLHNKE